VSLPPAREVPNSCIVPGTLELTSTFDASGEKPAKEADLMLRKSWIGYVIGER
jgi:hypothetical protein